MSGTLRAAGTISALTLVSRVLGLVRDSLMAWALGASWVSGTFLLAWSIPNLLRRLLGEGALSASFLPVYTQALRREGPDAARGLLAHVSGTVIAILLPLVAAVIVLSLVLPASWIPPPDEGGESAIALLLLLNAILFPYALPVCLSALYSGAMNAHRSFAVPAAVPIALNLCWIAGLLLARPLGVSADGSIALLLAWFLVAGGILQVVMLIVPLARSGALARPRLSLFPAEPRARAVFVAMAPMVLGMSLAQINAMLDQLLAYYLVSAGATNYVYLANRLLLFPHALTALALAVAVFPTFAALASDQDRHGLRRSVEASASASILVTLPAAVGLMLIARDLVQVLFERGRFTPDDTVQTSWTTVCMVAGLPMIGLAQLYARAFYALGDAKTPAVQAGWLVLVNLALNLVLVLGFDMGTPGLATATSVTAALNAMLLARRLRARVPEGEGLGRAWLRCGAATAAMAVAVWAVRPEVGAEEGRWALVGWRIALPIGVAIAVYFALLRVMRAPELARLRRRR